MALRFETGHIGDEILLTLIDDEGVPLWQGIFERFKAQALVDMLASVNPHEVIYVQYSTMYVMTEGTYTCLCIGGSGPFLQFKVALSAAQVVDLASTIRMHIIASEQETRPKDILPPMDDTIGHWTPEKEKEHFGPDGPDDDHDPADDWKKGK